MRVIFVAPTKCVTWRDTLYQWCVLRVSKDYVHVAIGNREVTLNPVMRGNEFWPTDVFIDKYPGVAGYFEVPCRSNLTGFEGVKSRRWWHYFARLLGKQHRDTDCITTVSAVLDFPPVLTPDQLWDYLRENGYEWIETSGHEARDAERDLPGPEKQVPRRVHHEPGRIVG